MKSKRPGKKPALNKKTVSNLKNDEMKKVKGGEIEITLPRVICISNGPGSG
jgi:hypothetical protein